MKMPAVCWKAIYHLLYSQSFTSYCSLELHTGLHVWLCVSVFCSAANLDTILPRWLLRKLLLFLDELHHTEEIVSKALPTLSLYYTFAFKAQNIIWLPFPIIIIFFNWCQGMRTKSCPHRKHFICLSYFTLGHYSPKHSWMLSSGTAAGDKRFICSWHPFCLIWNQASLSPGASCSLCSTLCLRLWGLGSYRS